MTYTSQNFTSHAPEFKDGDVLVACHCGQERPHTEFGNGAKGLRFVRCNLNNCDIPPDAITEGCVVCHMDWVAVATIAAVDYEKRVKDEALAIEQAHAKVLAEPVLEKVTIAQALADMEVRKAVEAKVAIEAVATAASAEGKELPDVSDCTPRPDCDERGNVVSYTFYRREVVK